MNTKAGSPQLCSLQAERFHSGVRSGTLTRRAEVRRPSCLSDSADRAAATPAHLSLAIVHGEPAGASFVGVSPGQPLLGTQNQPDRVDELLQLCPTYFSRGFARIHLRLPQRLGSVNVAEPGHDGLIHEGRLDGDLLSGES